LHIKGCVATGLGSYASSAAGKNLFGPSIIISKKKTASVNNALE
jgi:hypothetical protein